MNSQLPMTGKGGTLASRTPCLYARSAMRRQTIAKGLARSQRPHTRARSGAGTLRRCFPANGACFCSSSSNGDKKPPHGGGEELRVRSSRWHFVRLSLELNDADRKA